MVVIASLAAAVQGMDEAVINGAQLIYPKQFDIDTSTCTFVIFLIRNPRPPIQRTGAGWSALSILHHICP